MSVPQHASLPRHAAPPKPHTKRKYLALVIIAPLLLAGSAYAYFALSVGTGHVTVADPLNLTITLSAPIGTPLTPGGPQQEVPFTVTNNTSQPQTLSAESFAMTSDTAGGVYDTVTNQYVDTCLASWFSVSGGDGGVPLPKVLSQGQSLTAGLVFVTMSNSGTDQSACVNLQPQVTVAAS